MPKIKVGNINLGYMTWEGLSLSIRIVLIKGRGLEED